MLLEKHALGADQSAFLASTNGIQAVADFDRLAPVPPVYECCSGFLEPQRGTWFDEGYDFRELEGTAFAANVLSAIAAVDFRKNKRTVAAQDSHEMLVRKLLANAIRCTNYHTLPFVSIQRRAETYSGKPIWLSGKAMARTTDLLAKAGMIDLVIGRHNIASTTYAATPKLMAIAANSGVTENSVIYRMPTDRTVRLRAGNRATELLGFNPNGETESWSAQLSAYNDFLARQNIDIGLNEDETTRLTARLNAERSKGKLPYAKPEFLRKCLYRQFNNGSFDDGGRLYGGWWINCPKALRQRITINGEPTVELDFSGCLIRMLYHLAQIDYRDDPYWLEPLDVCEQENGLGSGHFREPVKRMMQALINGRAGRHNERIRMPNKQTFRPHFSRIEVADMLKAKHRAIADTFYTEAGVKLQRIESDIALTVIDRLKYDGIPVLPIHDSFIAPLSKKSSLFDSMNYHYESTVGYRPIIK